MAPLYHFDTRTAKPVVTIGGQAPQAIDASILILFAANRHCVRKGLRRHQLRKLTPPSHLNGRPC